MALMDKYIQSAVSVSDPTEVAKCASLSLQRCYDGVKSEGWVDTWGKYVTALATATPGAHALQPIASWLVHNLRSTMSTSPNAKKLAQSLHSKLPEYAAALYHHPEVRNDLQSGARELFFPLPFLQTVEPLKQLLALLTGDAAHLALVPFLFKTYIDAIKTHRYALYARAEGPVDVIIADKTRAAVIPALASCTDLLDRVENAALAQPGSSSSIPAEALALWTARHELWDSFLVWGGYLESDDRAGSLVAAEAKRASSALAMYGASDASSTDEGLAGQILRTLDALERLDHDRTALDTSVIGWCLASPSRTHAAARALLLSNLRFHQLTHALGGFFDRLADATRALFDPSLPADTLDPLYALVAAGPLSDRLFTHELRQACRAVNLGSRRGLQWAKLIGDLAGRIGVALSVDGSAGDKRKRPNMDSAGRLVAVLSRLVKIIVDAGARARPGDTEVEATIDAAVQAFGNNIPPSERNKKLKTGDYSTSDLIFAARIRVAGAARLIHRDNDVLPLDALAQLLLSDALPELKLDLFCYLYTHLALSPQDVKRSEVIDTLLNTLDGGKRSWTGREASVTAKTLASAAWTITAERGLSVFDEAAEPAQLSRLAGIIVSRVDGGTEGLATATAIRSVLGNAQTWELPSFRTALMRSLVEPDTKRGVFVVLSYCPTSWLSKNARNALLETAYNADAQADDETRGYIRSWLARMAEAKIYGPLDGAKLKHLVKTGDNSAEETLGIVKAAYPTFYASIIDDVKKPYASWATGKRDVRSRAVTVLLDILAESSLEAIRDKARVIFTTAHANLAAAIDAGAVDSHLLLAWGALSRVAEALDLTIEGFEKRFQILQRYPRSAVPLLDVSAVISTDQLLSTYINLDPTSEVDTAMRKHASKLRTEDYATAMESLVPLLLPEGNIRTLPGILRAIAILFSSSVEGSGRIIAQHIDLILARCFLISTAHQDISVLEATLKVLTAALEDRTGLLRLANVAMILTILGPLLRPSKHELQAPHCAPEILPKALSPLLTLVRRRADLVIQDIPPLVGLLSSCIAILQRARTTSSAAQKKAASRRPWWLSTEPSPDPAAEHAALIARILVSLCSAKTEDGQKLAGPLAKHASAVLVAYARAASDPWAGLSPAVRKEIEPGLFALCEVVTAGGRADGRGREGEGVGAAFGLGDAHGDAEREVWADVWRAWGKKRYVGRG